MHAMLSSYIHIFDVYIYIYTYTYNGVDVVHTCAPVVSVVIFRCHGKCILLVVVFRFLSAGRQCF
jgi:hypothetical protein